MSKVPSEPGNEPAQDPGMMALQTDEEHLAHAAPVFPSTRYKALSAKHLDEIPQLERLSADDRFAMKVVANVLPFRSNRYVIDNLIDWDRVPDDPLYQITFPQQGMLEEVDFLHMADLMRRDASANEIKAGAHEIREKLNPHPAGQRELNIPQVAHETINGLQHKYRETVLFFPSQGQTCHAYCTFCFRWAQFVGDNTLKIVAKEADGLHDYLAAHPDVTDLLITGGDPMIMKTSVFAHYLEPLVEDPRFEHVQDIRIGTKSLTFWPSRFVGDDDADDMVRLLEKIVKAGKHVAIMAHFNHWQELETDVVREAIRRLRDAGAVIRCQAPLLAHINDSSDVWIRMWEEEVRLGMIPYYMFVERDTGARNYFEVPLEQDLRHLSRRHQVRVRPCPYRPRPEHERDPRQDRDPRRAGDRRREGVHSPLSPGPEPRLGRASVLRGLRSESHVVRPLATRLRPGEILLHRRVQRHGRGPVARHQALARRYRPTVRSGHGRV